MDYTPRQFQLEWNTVELDQMVLSDICFGSTEFSKKMKLGEAVQG